MKTPQAFRLAAAALIPLLASCKPQPIVTSAPAAAPTGASDSGESHDLSQAIDSLRKLAEGTSPEGLKRTYFYFNQWLVSSPQAKAPWQPDKLIENLPPALQQTPGLERLGKLRFDKDDLDPLLPHLPVPPGLKPEDLRKLRGDMARFVKDSQDDLWLNDIAYFQQALWLHDIAERVSKQPPPAELKDWLKKIETAPGMGLPEAEQLSAAARLFDWTIRNVQLDPLPPMPKAPKATVDPNAKEKSVAISPALLGEVGPGYAHLPFQILLYGHGDAHERARIFIQLCRQAGIEAVMLGLDDEASPIPRPWVPAVLVGGQLYLFDTTLGLPIKGLEGQGIATLDQVAENPESLQQLAAKGQPPYPIGAKDLKHAIALIDAEPAALSRRMALLQAALPRTSRLALSVQPSRLEPELRKSKWIIRVALWRAPLEAIYFQVGRMVLLQKQSTADTYAFDERLFNPHFPLWQARNLHLQGRLEDAERETGARTFYLACRTPDRQIQATLNNEFFRKSSGMEERLPNDPRAKKTMIDLEVAATQRVKHHATYWLGLTYYDEGNYNTALEFLGKRTVAISPPSPWDAGARYNLARCYEELGQLDLARQWLESDKDSPQKAGNLLRAEWLAKRQNPEGETTAASRP